MGPAAGTQAIWKWVGDKSPSHFVTLTTHGGTWGTIPRQDRWRSRSSGRWAPERKAELDPGLETRPQGSETSRDDSSCSTHPQATQHARRFRLSRPERRLLDVTEARRTGTSNLRAGSGRQGGPAGDSAPRQRLRKGPGPPKLRAWESPEANLKSSPRAGGKRNSATPGWERALLEDGGARATARLQHPPLGGPSHRYHHLLRRHDPPLRVHPASERQEAHPGTSLRQVSALPDPTTSLPLDLGHEKCRDSVSSLWFTSHPNYLSDLSWVTSVSLSSSVKWGW